MLMPESPCPCGGLVAGAPWAQCCAPFVDDGQWPATAEQLMRSRYSAFATRNEAHLWRTWHPKTRPAQIGDLSDATWVRLTVLASESGGEQDSDGTVDFDAEFIADGQRGHVREHSRFAKRAGRWFYVDGDELDA